MRRRLEHQKRKQPRGMPKQWQPKRKPLPPLPLFAAVFVSTVGLGIGYTNGLFANVAGWFTSAPAQMVGSNSTATGEMVSFSTCHTGGGRNCVVDGDTIWLNGENIRIADIDTPETHDFRCPSEKALGDRATVRLREVLHSGPITLATIDRDEDRFGRKLRIVMVNGESVGETLVDEGLARWYEGGRQPWC